MYKYIYIYIHICICVCVNVFPIKGGVDVSGLLIFPSIRHRNTINFDMRKTLYL